MVTRKAKQSMIAAVTFSILPALVVIKSAHTLFGSGPEIVSASYAANTPLITPDAAIKDESSLTDQETKALDHIAVLKTQQFGPSPLHRVVVKASIDKAPSVPSAPEALQITVQMIMSSTSGNTALIDGEPFKVGQTYKKSDWVISTIDGEARSVTLKNTKTGKTRVFEVHTSE